MRTEPPRFDPSHAALRDPNARLPVVSASPAYAVTPFPTPGDLLAAVLIEWDAIEATGAPSPPDLPRPWEPATCRPPGLHAELVAWLSDVADWVNAQHTWNPDTAIPVCWAYHPHLVHDLAVLTDHRRRAGNEPSSLLLEQWHRITLPSFLDRMRLAIGQRCAAGHQAPYTAEPLADA